MNFIIEERNKQYYHNVPYIFLTPYSIEKNESIIRKGCFVEILVILIVEIMSSLKLDHHGKPESTGRSFLPIVGLLSSAHP